MNDRVSPGHETGLCAGLGLQDHLLEPLLVVELDGEQDVVQDAQQVIRPRGEGFAAHKQPRRAPIIARLGRRKRRRSNAARRAPDPL